MKQHPGRKGMQVLQYRTFHYLDDVSYIVQFTVGSFKVSSYIRTNITASNFPIYSNAFGKRWWGGRFVQSSSILIR